MLKKCLRLSSIIAVSMAMMACQTASHSMHYVPQKVIGLKTPESVVQAKDGRIFISENAISLPKSNKDGVICSCTLPWNLIVGNP